MKSASAFLALVCVLVGCKEEKERVSVEDVFNKTDKQVAAVDKGPLQPIIPKSGTIIYKIVKSKKAIEAEQKRVRDEAAKDCGGDYSVVNDDYASKKPTKAPTFEYRCGE